MVAEDLHVFLPPASGAEREDWGDVVLFDEPMPAALLATASRVRFGSHPAESITAVRGWFAGRGRAAFTRYLGRYSTPPDLERRLRDHGATEDPAEPEHTAMVLDHEPDPFDSDVEVRRVEGFEDFSTSQDIFDVGFGGSFTADELATMAERRPAQFADYQRDPRRCRYLALMDGAPISAATGILSDIGVVLLTGGATLPQARGRGAYRALLVRARWDDGVAHGCTAMVTQTSEMSRPALESMGSEASAASSNSSTAQIDVASPPQPSGSTTVPTFDGVPARPQVGVTGQARQTAARW